MLTWIILTKMSHETRLVENSNVFLEFITLDYHVVNIPFSNFYSTHTAITYLPINKNKNKKQKTKISYHMLHHLHQLTLHAFQSLLIFYFFNFYLFILFFIFLIGCQFCFQFCFLFFNCILGWCGFLFFLSFVKVTWDGR